jgi:hypothetical protein
MTIRIPKWALTACMSALVSSLAHAQLIDDIEFRREGNNAVVQFHFVTPVQYQNSVITQSGDLVQVFYNVQGSPETFSMGGRSERRVDGIQGLPEIIVTDEFVTGSVTRRKMVLKYSEATRQQVRAGRVRQSIEIVLDGRGPALSAAFDVPPEPAARPSLAAVPVAVPAAIAAPSPAAIPAQVAAPAPAAIPAAAVATATETQGRYVIRLQSSATPRPQLAAPVPAQFQDRTVFNSLRQENGKPVYEVNLGYFATVPAAEAARTQLQGSFPAAAVMMILPRAAAATAAAPTPSAAPASAAAPAAAAAIAAAAPASRPVSAAKPAAVAAAVTPPPLPRPAVPNLPPLVSVAPGSDTITESTLLTQGSQAEFNAQGARLLAGAMAALDRGDSQVALETLNSLLNLPTTPSSRKGQELIGQARLRLGDTERARKEFELFLQLYPKGADSDQVRKLLATLPKAAVTAVTAARPRPPMEPISSTSGSVSLFYFGGQSQVRTQDFQNSPISGLPVLQSASELSGNDLRQYQTNIDLNWRYRDIDKDMRFVFRDTATYDQMPNGSNRNRLSALYFDQRSFLNGTNFRIGRQSPNGGGVMYRFDGVSAGYSFVPKWRVNAVYGKPSEDLLDTQRRFYGVSLEAEALTSEISGNLYFNQGEIDGEIDRKAVGTELRYFSGGIAMSAQVDYDQVLAGMNIASLQGSWLFPDTTAVNFMYDRRSTPFRSLSNVLFFQDPNAPTLARKITDLLQTNTLESLRAQVNAITAMQTQGMVGITTPIAKNWQTGGNVTYVNVGEIAPVANILPNGQPSTGDLWSVGFQLIGSNLYSVRDTHVYNLSLLSGPTYNGRLLSYNNLSSLSEKWQVEPSIRYYTQVDNTDTQTKRWTPGLRITYRVAKQVSLETEATYEISEVTGPLRTESSTRLFYYFGGRYDF